MIWAVLSAIVLVGGTIGGLGLKLYFVAKDRGELAVDLVRSEGDRDRLEEQLRELVKDRNADAEKTKKRIDVLLAEQDLLRAEIRRRRRPGDARSRLRVLSEAARKAASRD